MIGILGPKRLLVLIVLVSVNALLALAVYTHLIPEQIAAERKLGAARGQASSTQNDIDNLMIEFEQLEQQQAEFDALKGDNFISNQDRREAERILQGIQTESGVVSAVANIRVASVDKNETAAKADHVVLESPVEITIEALDDVDLYRYYDMLMQRFPGHIAVKKIFVNRELDLSNPVLRAIGSGEKIALVKAKFEMTWKTMLPLDEANSVVGEGGLE